MPIDIDSIEYRIGYMQAYLDQVQAPAAVQAAFQYLVDHMVASQPYVDAFEDEEEEIEEEVEEPAQEEEPEEATDDQPPIEVDGETGVDSIGLSTRRAVNALHRGGIFIVSELCAMTEADLKALPGVGGGVLDDIKNTLARHDLSLAGKGEFILEDVPEATEPTQPVARQNLIGLRNPLVGEWTREEKEVVWRAHKLGDKADTICCLLSRGTVEDVEALVIELENDPHFGRYQQNQAAAKAAAVEKYGTEFEQFWDSYPRKNNKEHAFKTYNSVRNAGVSHHEIMEQLDARFNPKAAAGDMRYTPHAQTFLQSLYPSNKEQ